MQFVVDQLSLLGMNAREIRTFTTIATFGQMKVTVIARRAGLPRTTVDAIVRRLEQQGILEPIVIQKHVEWAVDLEKVSILLSMLSNKITSTSKKIGPSDIFDEFSVKYVTGDEHEGLKDSTSLRRLCEIHLTPHGLLLSDIKGKRGVHIAHTPLRLKLSELLPSSLWEGKVEEVEEYDA